MPVSRPAQFELATQIESGVSELESAMIEAENAVNRVRYLSGKLIADVKRLEDAANDFDAMTEEEAAAALKIHPTLLAKERKRHNLPHVALSNKIRYTPDQLRRICEILEPKTNTGASRVKRAA